MSGSKGPEIWSLGKWLNGYPRRGRREEREAVKEFRNQATVETEEKWDVRNTPRDRRKEGKSVAGWLLS